jgi:hypothetical protein
MSENYYNFPEIWIQPDPAFLRDSKTSVDPVILSEKINSLGSFETDNKKVSIKISSYSSKRAAILVALFIYFQIEFLFQKFSGFTYYL